MANTKSFDRMPDFCVYQKLANEYVFALAIQKVNQQRLENHQRPMTVKEARYARSQWIENLRQQPTMKGYLNTLKGYVAQGKHFNYSDESVLGFAGKYFLSMRGGQVSEEAQHKCDLRTSEMLDTLNAVLPEAGITKSDYELIANKMFEEHAYRDNNTYSDTTFIPLSPYDETFQSRAAFLQNPMDVVYVDKSKFNPNYGELYVRPTGITHDVQVYRGRTSNWNTSPSRYKSLDDYPFYGASDVTGYAAFKPYLTADEYAKIENVYIAAHMKEHPTADQLAQSAELLRRLNEEGYDYTVTCRDSGEMIARLEDSGINVTIVPQAGSDFNFNFGKLMTYNMNYRFSTDVRKSTGDGKYQSEPYKATADNVMDLIHFAEGKPVEKVNRNALDTNQTTYVGEPSYVVSENRARNKKAGENHVVTNTAYYVGNKATFQYDAANGNLYRSGNISMEPVSRERTRWFGVSASVDNEGITPQDDAIAYLQDAVTTARANFETELALDDIMNQVEAHADDPDYVYPYSTDETIASVQKSYWQFMTGDVVDGKPPMLAVVGTERSHFGDDEDESVGDAAYYDDGPIYQLDDEGHPMLGEDGEPIIVKSAARVQLEHHMRDTIDAQIGTYEADADGKRFNPVGVASYMTTEQSLEYNNDSMIVAMDLAGIKADELKGSDYYAGVVQNRLLKFDETTAVNMSEHESSFMRKMQAEIKRTLETSGCVVTDDDILIDENGIVQYKVKQVNGKSKGLANPSQAGLTTVDKIGYIGQIFAPEPDYPGVKTRFANGNNYMFVPGYTATVLPQKEGENLTLEERTRLTGYEQHMMRAIRSHIKEDMLSSFARYEGAPAGETTSLNHVYRQLYDVRHELDYVERTAEEGMSDDLRKAILETEASRVSYGKKFKEGATLNASYQSSRNPQNLMNDLNNDALTLTGGRNVAILSEEGDGYFDRDATSTGITQGITRYLVRDAKVDDNGKIIPNPDKTARTPLFEHEYMKFSDNVPFDRRQMVFNNLLKSQAVTEPVKMAQITLAGWNFDDGFVVTKRFAEQYMVRDHSGNMRAMQVGDKILDFGGNKGVEPLVFDNDMTREEAEKQGLLPVWKFFNANPEVDVVGAPFSAVGRFNASTYLECSQETIDMVNPETGAIIPGAVGTARFIITHMTVDEKTHIYDDEEFEKGNGRSASAQLGWGLDSKGSVHIKRSFYGDNDRAFQNMREYMIVCGLDMDATGNILSSYTAQPGENRNVFDMPTPRYKTVHRNGKEIIQLDTKGAKNDFIQEIGKKGGFLKLPFALNFPENGGPIPRIVEEDGTVSYGLPVLSSYLRSGQRFEDGTQSVHDYTKQYSTIYEHAVRYLDAQSKLEANGISAADRTKYEAELQKSMRRAQRAYDEITGDIIKHKFDSKYNAFKSEMMTNKLPRSATAVWTADPRLDIEDIAIGKEMAETLGVKEGDGVMVWRDPLLRDAGVRYLNVKIDENLVGVAINPVMDKGYDGDFDGDSVAIVALNTQLADEMTPDELKAAARAAFNEEWRQNVHQPELTDDEIESAKDHRYQSHNNAIRREVLQEVADEWRERSENPELSESMYSAGQALMDEQMANEDVRAKVEENKANAWERARLQGMSEDDFNANWDAKQLYHYSKMAARRDFISEQRQQALNDYRAEHPDVENINERKVIDSNMMEDFKIDFEIRWLNEHGSQALKDAFKAGYDKAVLSDKNMTLPKYKKMFYDMSGEERGKMLHDACVEHRTKALRQFESSEGYNGKRAISREEFDAMLIAEHDAQREQAVMSGTVPDDFEKDWNRRELNDLKNHARMVACDSRLAEYVATENNGNALNPDDRKAKLVEFSAEWREAHTSNFLLDEERRFRDEQLADNPDMTETDLRKAWNAVDKAALRQERRREAFSAYMEAYDRERSAEYVHDRLYAKAIRNGKTPEEFEEYWTENKDKGDIQGQIDDAYETRGKRDAKRTHKILEHRAIRDEAERLFSVEANLLDYGVKNEDGSFDIMMNHGLDLKMSEYKRPELKEVFEGITADINEFESQYNEGTLSYEDVSAKRKDAVARINDYVHDAFDHNVCEAVVSYENDKAHMASLDAIVQSGAKGNPKKLVDYGKYAGMKVQLKEDEAGNTVVDVDNIEITEDHKPLAGRKDDMDVQYATAVKASVGIAGKYSQRGMKNCRDACAKAVLEMTYPATQGLLQAKHDPIDARQKYEMLMTSLRDCWKGFALKVTETEELDQYGQPTGNMCRVWVKDPVLDEKGRQVFNEGKPCYRQATTEEWTKQVVEICTAKDGLNVPINPDYAEDIAKALTNEDGFVRGVEETSAGCLLDRLAYKNAGDSALAILRQAAKDGENIYDGDCASRFMSKSVERNVRAVENGEFDKVTIQSKSDTKSKDDMMVQVMSESDYSKYETETKTVTVDLDANDESVVDYIESDADFEAVSPMDDTSYDAPEWDNQIESDSQMTLNDCGIDSGNTESVQHPNYNPAAGVPPTIAKKDVEAAKAAKKTTVVQQQSEAEKPTKPKKKTYNPAAKPNNDGHPPKTMPNDNLGGPNGDELNGPK